MSPAYATAVVIILWLSFPNIHIFINLVSFFLYHANLFLFAHTLPPSIYSLVQDPRGPAIFYKQVRSNATTAASMAKFLCEFIWCQYGCPIELISDQGGQFLGQVVESLMSFYVVVHKRSTPYYPQANGLAELTNKTLQNILQKIINKNQTDWDTKLQSALWAYRTTYKTSIRTTPFRLAFSLEAVMSIEFQIPSLRIQVKERLSEKESEKIRLATLCELEEH